LHKERKRLQILLRYKRSKSPSFHQRFLVKGSQEKPFMGEEKGSHHGVGKECGNGSHSVSPSRKPAQKENELCTFSGIENDIPNFPHHRVWGRDYHSASLRNLTTM
jgi:hypothetical protein